MEKTETFSNYVLKGRIPNPIGIYEIPYFAEPTSYICIKKSDYKIIFSWNILDSVLKMNFK